MEPCPLGTRVGAFEVGHYEFYAAVTGTVKDGIIPLEVLQPVLDEGDCRLLRKENPFCDPPCGGGEVCDHSGECLPHPKNVPVGEVSVTGLVEDPLVLEPNFANYYQQSAVPFPLFEPGAAIALSAEGEGQVPPLVFHGVGVPDLTLPEGVVTMVKGEDLAVQWDPAPGDGPWRIAFSLNVDQHGNSPVTLVCDTDDDGSHVVPAALVTEMLDFGVSGFATMDVVRRTVDAKPVPKGCVELLVVSTAPGQLSVSGHTPCNFDAQCPEGQVCQVEINTCVAD
jgi:hypothetical protein